MKLRHLAVLASGVIVCLPTISIAKGCIKGAAVGGVAGHVAGDHAVAGAAIGCAVGHHEAKVKAKKDAQQAMPPQPEAPPPQATHASNQPR